jgi:hypothetical protein
MSFESKEKLLPSHSNHLSLNEAVLQEKNNPNKQPFRSLFEDKPIDQRKEDE